MSKDSSPLTSSFMMEVFNTSIPNKYIDKDGVGRFLEYVNWDKFKPLIEEPRSFKIYDRYFINPRLLLLKKSQLAKKNVPVIINITHLQEKLKTAHKYFKDNYENSEYIIYKLITEYKDAVYYIQLQRSSITEQNKEHLFLVYIYENEKKRVDEAFTSSLPFGCNE